ncbi:MAG: GNAT family N-acetyltransferase [Gammaproteobacteria bacterium]|nr:GNAT family N-acetyltransferase [Gammaproteobacteria bacterium]
MDIEYRLATPPFCESRIEELLELTGKVFGNTDAVDGPWRLRNMPDVTLLEARRDGKLVGFKIGYAITSTRYYSWLGGVDPDHRRLGIAGELMTRQHDWISRNGYASVETGVQQENLAMTRLNLASGFQVVGIRFKDLGPEITYQKRLSK